MFLDAAQFDKLTVAFSSFFWQRNDFSAGKVITGDGSRCVHDLLRGAVGHNLTAMDAGTRADIHDPVRSHHRLFIMFDNNQAVAKIPHALHGRNELGIVTLVQADAWLIHDIQDTGQLGADLGSQTDPLTLTAAQRACQSVQSQVIQADIGKELQTAADFLDDKIGNLCLLCIQLQIIQPEQSLLDTHLREVSDVLVTNHDT